MQCQTAVREWLTARAQELGPSAFLVEVGTWKGDTAILLASGGGLVFCIDSFNGQGMSNVTDSLLDFTKNVAGRRIVGLLGQSVPAAHLLPDRCADLVFIDASHDLTSVRRDIEAWRHTVKAGGYLCGDDWNLESVRMAVQEALGGAEVIGEYGWWIQLG